MRKLNNVMLIDDDEIYQFLCGKIIKESGVTENVISSLDVKEALNHFKENQNEIPELVFLDINMPGLNGWDFLEHFKKLNIDLKHPVIIVMHSSSVFPEDKIKAGEYEEVYDFIDKPLTINSIRELTEKYFSK